MMVKLQVPVEKEVRDKLAKRARQLGFDSVQAYIRFWAKAEVDGRTVDLGEDEWGEPHPNAVKRLDRWAEEARAGKNVSGPFHTVEEALQHLHSL